ncbi:MAG: hypothetical protein Fur0024_2270 [Patescibacteria group bacterium]
MGNQLNSKTEKIKTPKILFLFFAIIFLFGSFIISDNLKKGEKIQTLTKKLLFERSKIQNLESKIKTLETYSKNLEEKNQENENEKISSKEEKKIKDIFSKVQKIRGLSGTLPDKILKKTPTEALNYITSSFENSTNSEKFLNEEKILKILNLIPKDSDYKKILFKLFETQIGGFYDSSNGSLVLVSKNFSSDLNLSESEEYILSHELTHRLQDENLDLLGLLDNKNLDNDTSLALLATIEGDATFVMERYRQQENLQISTSKDEILTTKTLLSSPTFIQDNLLFPYSEGYDFIKKVLESKKINFDFIYKNPPKTTEQIIHPEKFLSKEEPRKLEFDEKDFLQNDEKILYSTTGGEFFLRSFFKENLTRKNSSCSAGWGNDKIFLIENNKNSKNKVFWIMNFDSSEDFDETKSCFEKVQKENENFCKENCLKNQSKIEVSKKPDLLIVEFEN